MNVTNQKAKLGPAEWIKIVIGLSPIVLGCAGWMWNQSDRLLLLESAVRHQTAILERLDSDRELRAVQTEQLKELARRIEKMETRKSGT